MLIPYWIKHYNFKMHIARSFSTFTEIYLINAVVNVDSVTLDGRYDEIS